MRLQPRPASRRGLVAPAPTRATSLEPIPLFVGSYGKNRVDGYWYLSRWIDPSGPISSSQLTLPRFLTTPLPTLCFKVNLISLAHSYSEEDTFSGTTRAPTKT